jgi:hypothetical protein
MIHIIHTYDQNTSRFTAHGGFALHRSILNPPKSPFTKGGLFGPPFEKGVGGIFFVARRAKARTILSWLTSSPLVS